MKLSCIGALFLAACSPLPIGARNACLPDAIRVRDAMGEERDARIILVERGRGGLSHAYCIFRDGKKILAYDSVGGTRRLRSREMDCVAYELEPCLISWRYIK